MCHQVCHKEQILFKGKQWQHMRFVHEISYVVYLWQPQ